MAAPRGRPAGEAARTPSSVGRVRSSLSLAGSRCDALLIGRQARPLASARPFASRTTAANRASGGRARRGSRLAAVGVEQPRDHGRPSQEQRPVDRARTRNPTERRLWGPCQKSRYASCIFFRQTSPVRFAESAVGLVVSPCGAGSVTIPSTHVGVRKPGETVNRAHTEPRPRPQSRSSSTPCPNCDRMARISPCGTSVAPTGARSSLAPAESHQSDAPWSHRGALAPPRHETRSELKVERWPLRSRAA